MLIEIHRRGFARGANDDDAIGPFCQVKIHQRTQTIQIQTAIIVHRRNDRDQTAFKHEIFSTKNFRALSLPEYQVARNAQSASRSIEQHCFSTAPPSASRTCPVTGLGRKTVQPFRPMS